MAEIMMTFLLSVILSGTSLRAADSMIFIADFEGEDYGDWKISGEAFGEKPMRGTLPRHMRLSSFRGKGLVSSDLGGDKPIDSIQFSTVGGEAKIKTMKISSRSSDKQS